MEKNENQFNNFKIHTQYSICEGAIKIDELADFCKKNNIKSVGFCDSFNLCGALEFSEKISKVGTQPIIGTQINFKLNKYISKIPIFATSENGFKNLSKLSSKSYIEIEALDEPHCKIEDLLELNEGIIVLPRGITKSRKEEIIDITSPLAVVLDSVSMHTKGKYAPFQFSGWLFPSPRVNKLKLHDDKGP